MTQNEQFNEQIEELLQEMDSLSSYKRAEAIKQIGQFNIQIGDIPIKLHSQLEKALHDPEAVVRGETVMTLVFLEGKIAIDLIEPLLNDPVHSVRCCTIAALGYTAYTPPKSVINKMLEILKDPDPEIRERCARALGRLQVVQSKSELLRIARFDIVPAVRAGAIIALGMFEKMDPQVQIDINSLLHTETSKIVITAINETLVILKNHIKEK